MQVEPFVGTQKEWNAWTAANAGGIMQSFEWGEFRGEFGWNPQRLVVRDSGEIVLAASVLEKPLPSGYCFFYTPEGPVLKDGDWKSAANKTAFELLGDYLKTQAKNCKALFLKIDPHVETEQFDVKWLQGQGFRDSPEDIQPAFVTHVDLQPSEEDILASMKQKGRYNIRYAQKKDVTVRRGQTEADLKTFYDLLKQTAERQGITYRDEEYFVKFREHFMVAQDQAEFFFAEYAGKPIATTLVTYFGDESVYLYGGSSEEDRNVFGSYLIQWEGMKAAKARGCTYYNMTGVAHDDDPNNRWAGLRQFKLKFGGPVIELVGAWDYVYQPLTYKAFTFADKARRGLAKVRGRARTQ